MSPHEIIVDNHSLDVSFLNDSDFVRRGLEMAIEAHAGEFRKVRGEPFLTHCLGVAAIASKYDRSDETQVMSLLHDVIDSPVARERITMTDVREEFGIDMVLGIASLSKSRVLREEAARRQDYLSTTATETSPRVQITRLADKTDNATKAANELMFVEDPNDFFRLFNGGRDVYLQWPLDVLASVEKSGVLPGHPIVDECHRAIERLHMVAAMRAGNHIGGWKPLGK